MVELNAPFPYFGGKRAAMALPMHWAWMTSGLCAVTPYRMRLAAWCVFRSRQKFELRMRAIEQIAALRNAGKR